MRACGRQGCLARSGALQGKAEMMPTVGLGHWEAVRAAGLGGWSWLHADSNPLISGVVSTEGLTTL